MKLALVLCIAALAALAALAGCSSSIYPNQLAVATEACAKHGGVTRITANSTNVEQPFGDTFHCADGARFVITNNGRIL